MRFIDLSGSDGTKRFQHSAINYVYALFYKGECVYIGITRNPNSRETDHHRSTGKMFDEMRVITSNIDRDKMELQEKALIIKHSPKYNNNFNRKSKKV